MGMDNLLNYLGLTISSKYREVENQVAEADAKKKILERELSQNKETVAELARQLSQLEREHSVLLENFNKV